MLRRFFMMALADLNHTVRAILNTALGLAGRVASLIAAPVPAESELSIDLTAEAFVRPAAPMVPEAGISAAVEAEQIHTLERAVLPLTRECVILGIEADVYVYNKAEIVMDEGTTLELRSQAAAGICAPASMAEDLAIDLSAQAYTPDSAPLSYSGNVLQLDVQSLPSTPEACPMAAEPEPVELGVEGEIHALDARDLSGIAGVTLGIEAVVTVLPVAAVAAELELALDTAADVADKTAWIYPEQTAEYLYIRQVCNVVTDQA